MFNIKTAVIGVGQMGRHHARVYSEISNLIAVSDPDEIQGKKIAENLNVAWYPKIEDLYGKVDAVSIAVPTQYHKEVIELVSSAGLNFIVEKPLAGSYESSQYIHNLVKDLDLISSVGHIERHNQVVRFAKERIVSKEWGNIKSISARRFSSFPERINDVGVLFDLTIHDVDILTYLINDDVERVYTTGGKAKNQKYEDYINMSLNFSNGAIGHCQTNWLSPIKVRDLSIITDSHYIYLDYLKQEIRSISIGSESSESKETVLKLDNIEPLKTELSNFLSSIVSSKKPDVTIEDGIHAVKIVEAGLKSLKTGSVIKLK